MAPGLGTLRRLAAVYELLEEQAAMDLQKSVSEVVRTKQAMHRENRILRSAACDFEQAQVRGDVLEATIATGTQTVAERRQAIFEERLVEREKRSAEANRTYKSHRLKLEQIRQLLGRANVQLAAETERKEQSIADDRFLATKKRGRRLNSEGAG
jgi:hypothetical protein